MRKKSSRPLIGQRPDSWIHREGASKTFRNQAMALALLAAFSINSVGTPAKADDKGAAIFLGIMGAMIAADQNAKAQSRNNAEANAERAAYRQLVVRTQTALQTLGFYKMAIDGSSGPGTERALRGYLQAFKLQSFDFREDHIATLELIAASGFRNGAERDRAAAGGFRNRNDYLSAQAAGFRNMSEFESARSIGARDVNEYRAFSRSGFNSIAQYRAAEKNGFETVAELRRAQNAGFSSGEEYRDFIASGAANRETYLSNIDAKEAAAAASRLCLSNSAAATRAPACAQSLIANRADTQVRESYRGIADDTLIQLDSAQQQLDKELTSRNGGDTSTTLSAQIERTERRIAELAATGALADCVLGATESTLPTNLVALEASCERARSAYPELDQIRPLLQRVNDLRAERREEAEREQEAIALAKARDDAARLLGRIEQFNLEGGSFAEAVQVARVVVNLRSALEGSDADATIRALNAGQIMISNDLAFTAFVARAQKAEQQARAQAVKEARNDLERYHAFIKTRVAGNVFDPNTSKYLEFLESAALALSTGGTKTLTRARADAVVQLKGFGLLSDAEAFELEAEKQASEQNLAKVGAAGIAADRALINAQDLLGDVRGYSETGAAFDNPLEVARAINALMKAVEQNDPAVLDRAMITANAAFGANADFAAFRDEEDALRNAGRSDALVISEARARAINDYIIASLSRNPFDQNLSILLELQAEIERALTVKNSSVIVAAQERAVSVLNGLGLVAEVEAAMQGAEIAAATETMERTESGLAVTALNREILEGGGQDIFLLENRTTDAPNLSRNLKGELVFAGGAVSVCWAHPVPERSASVRLSIDGLRDLGANQITATTKCLRNGFTSTDLVALRRSDFLGQPADYASELLSLYESGDLSVLKTLNWAKVAARVDEFDALSSAIKVEVSSGLRDGIGYISLESERGAMCVVASETYEQRVLDFHRDLHQRELTLHLPRTRAVVSEDSERVFARTQRGECSAIQTDSAMMADLIMALDRERILFNIAPVWAGTDELSRIKDAFTADDASTAERLAALSQEIEADNQAAISQYELAQGVRRDRQIALRADFAQEARAAQDDIVALLAPVLDQDAPQTSASVRQLFPELAKWTQHLATELWKYEGHRFTLHDYGTASWQGRRLEAVVIEANISIFNSPRGERDTECMLIGYLIDAEFKMRRDPVMADCSGGNDIVSDWMASRSFESRWIAR